MIASTERVYYNEFDPKAADWLEWLISERLIPAGVVDRRSIKDVQPGDLRGFVHCHFFAGIGGWALASVLAGWPLSRPLWSGSCPCQPFSAAGRKQGADDPRHLWPDFFRLIDAERPPTVVGEQVAGALGEAWFDGVAADLGRADYAYRAFDIAAAAVDSPQIRQRLWWGAVAARALAGGDSARPASIGRDASEVGGLPAPECGPTHDAALSRGGDGAALGGMADPEGLCGGAGLREGGSLLDGPELADRPSIGAVAHGAGEHEHSRIELSERGSEGRASPPGDAEGQCRRGVALGDAAGFGRREGWPKSELRSGGNAPTGADARGGAAQGRAASEGLERIENAGGLSGYSPGRSDAQRANGGDGGYAGGAGLVARAYEPQLRGEPSAGEFPLDEQDPRAGLGARPGHASFWADAEWIICHDGKARRAQPGVPLLAHGIPGRVAAWRGFGNAIVPQLAAEVLASLLETT